MSTVLRHARVAILVGSGIIVMLAMTSRLAAQASSESAEPTSGNPPLRVIDDDRPRAAGIRRLTSSHLVLYTDLPADPEIDRLPAVFDQAVLQWAKYFGIDEADANGLQARAFLIGERRRFDALGLMPAGHQRSFVNGISIGNEIWLYDQPTAYYRRHLLLHEGTHVFMSHFLGGCGPGWYMEGTAELLGTHRLDERTGRLVLRIMPRSRNEVPMLGRIKLIRDAVAKQRVLDLSSIMQIDNRTQLGNEAYAWCWAAAKFLDAHPRYRDRFRRLHERVLEPDFNEYVRAAYAADWSDVDAEWRAFVATLDHGYDFERTAIDFQRGQPLEEKVATSIAANRGWQSSRVRLEAGKSYRITAAGRYEIANEGQPWPCEPGGVTIEYHDGRPLGMLLGAIDGRKQGATLADEFAIGLEATITPTASGTLYLRVNDSASRLDDNRGTLSVTIEQVDGARGVKR